MYILFFFTFFQITNAYQLCVVGASSGLGRELVYQGALDRNMSVLALTSSSSPIQVPCRVDSFQEIINQPPFFNPNVQKENYWNSLDDYDYENIVFTTSGGPFKQDYSDLLMSKLLPNLPKSCKKLTFVSAYGVGDSLNKRDFAINVMNDLYLKDVYRAKNKQEELLNLSMFRNKYPKLKIKILRPRALSYGETMLESTSRKTLANQILNDFCIFI